MITEERKQAFKQAFVLNAMPLLKELKTACGSSYVPLNATEYTKTFDVSNQTISAMVELKYLSCIGGSKSKSYYWKNANLTPSEQMAEAIYEKMMLNQNAKKHLKKSHETFETKLKQRGLVRVQGSKRESNSVEISHLVLRAMTAIHTLLNDRLMTKSMIYDAIHVETESDIISEKILEGLIDGNYIVIQHHELYSWKETVPDEAHAEFLINLMNENKSGKVTAKILNCLIFLYDKLKNYTHINLRDEFKKFGLGSNAQHIIAIEVLESESHGSGHRNSKKYKWKLKETPTKALVQSLHEKINEYNRKYYTPPVKKEKNITTAKIESQPASNTILDSNISLMSAISQMKIQRNALLAEINVLNAKIKEGEDILFLKEKEKTYLESCSTFITKGDHLKLKFIPDEKKKRRNNDDKTEIIINHLTLNGPTPLRDLYPLLYPGKVFSWDKDAQALSSLIHYMKKRNKIEDDQRKATYKIKAV